MATNKQALRGQKLEGRYYLAECMECGAIMPSNKLIVSRNYPDGDADCYCPHCNANDCDIADLGTGDAPAVTAWNYQQKCIHALLDELEADELQIKTLESRNRRLEGIIEAAEKRIAELEARAVVIPDDLDFDCEYENGACSDHEESWLRGRVDGFSDGVRITARAIRAAGILTKGE